MSPRYLGGKYRSRLHPRSRKCACYLFAGDCAYGIELRQIGVICFPWRQRRWSGGVFKSWISDARCPFQWKRQVLHNYDISVLQQVSMFFDGIACLMKVWPFSSGSSLVSRWRVPLTCACTREFQMWRRRCKQIDPHWFQGRQMRFWWMLSTMSWNSSWYIKSDYLVQQIFNQSPPAPTFNSLLAPATACESQATACDIEISLDMLWIHVYCICKENIFSMHWSISFLN